MLFSLNSSILLSKNNNEFQEDKELRLHITKDLGEGSYGKVFELNDQYAIKIFKQCTLGNVDLSSTEDSVLPSNEENRELQFYFEMLKKNKLNQSLSVHYILQPYAIGYTKEEITYKSKFEIHSYFVILPLCIPFYKLLPIKNIELLSLQKPNELFQNILLDTMININNQNDNIFGILFVLNIMKKICKASIYLEEEFKIYNLDFKISNIMFLKTSQKKKDLNDLNDLIVIDFGLIKHIQDLNSIFDYEHLIQQKYFIWPYSGTTLISNIPSYSICINGLELLLGKKEIEKLPSYRIIKKNILKLKNIDHNLYIIFYEGLINKCNTQKLLFLIQKYL